MYVPVMKFIVKRKKNEFQVMQRHGGNLNTYYWWKNPVFSVWCHMMGTCHYSFVQTQNGQHEEWTVM